MDHCKNYILSLWETTQTLFWASLGLISLDNFELAGIKVISLSWQSESLTDLGYPNYNFHGLLYRYPNHNCYILVIESIWLQEFTRFWGLVMFGTFSIINVIVLLNLLIAMMNNSYQVLSSVPQSHRKPDFMIAICSCELTIFAVDLCEIFALVNLQYLQLISMSSEKADTEWKFARSKLWISYFKVAYRVTNMMTVVTWW